MSTTYPATTPPSQRHVTATPAIAEAGQYLTFLLQGETYALGILRIKEIINYGHLTEVPMMPNFIKGVINLRGKVVPVVDLLARFGQGSTSIIKRTSIVIIETIDHLNESNESGPVTDIGIIVDAVNEVVDIAADAIEPAPSFGTRIRPEFIIGMAKREEQFMVMLAVDKVLAVSEMLALGRALFNANGFDNTH
jgi:purine-binding chemotaxis protein CheW